MHHKVLLSLKPSLHLLQTASLSTILPPPAKAARNAADEDFPECVWVHVCLKHSCPPLRRSTHLQGTWGHRVSEMHTCIHTHTLCGTCMTGHQLPAVLSFSLYLLCAKKMLSFSTHCSTVSNEKLVHSLPFCLSCILATHSAYSEKLISDSSLYWD